MALAETPPPASEALQTRKVAGGTAAFAWLGAFILAGACLVSLYPPLGTALYGPPLYPWALALFVLVTVCAAILIGMRASEISVRPERWALPLAAAVGLALLAAPHPDRAAFPALGLLLLPAAIILIAVLIDTSPNRATRCLNVFRALAFLAIAIALWGLFSWGVSDFGARAGAADHLARIAGIQADYDGLWSVANEHPFGHKNFAAGFAVLSLPILCAVLCLDPSRLRLLWLAGLPITLFYLASAESRAGWLALAAGVAFYLALRLWRAGIRRWGWWPVPIFLVVLAIPFLASPRLRESVQRVGQEGAVSAIDPYRAHTFQTAIAAGNARPLTGVGPGALPLVSPEHSPSVEYPVVYQAHSTPLQLYADTGILGVFGGFILAAGLVWSWQRGRKKRPLFEGHLADAAAVSLLAYAAFALTDYQLDVPLIALAAAVPAGVLLGLAGETRPWLRFHKTWATTAALAGVLLAPLFWFNGKGLLARLHLDNAVAQLNAEEIDSFFSEAEQAQAWAPTDPFYLNQLANVWLTEWIRSEDAAERARFSEKAGSALRQSLEIAPAQDSVHFNLGVLLRQEKPAEALEAFKNALQYNPRKRFAWFLRGQVLLEMGRPEEAAEAFARELLVNPSSLFLPLWREAAIQPHIEARNRHYERLIRTERTSPAERYLFHWSTGNPRPFEGDMARLTDGWQVLLTALEGDPEGAVSIAPSTSQALLVRAWLEPDEAEKWLRAAFFQASGSAFSRSNLELIGDRLKEGETFSAAFHSLLQEPGLPVITKQGRPRASGLFERNFYGAPLFDFHIYHEPIVLLLF